jgi:hypothetical protein
MFSKIPDYTILRMICGANSFIISNKKVLRGVRKMAMHRKVKERFERKALQSPQCNSATLWQRGTLRFHELYQIFRTILFFAAIRFQIFFMKLAIPTVGLFNPIAPVLIVLTFMTGG